MSCQQAQTCCEGGLSGSQAAASASTGHAHRALDLLLHSWAFIQVAEYMLQNIPLSPYYGNWLHYHRCPRHLWQGYASQRALGSDA